MDKIEAIGAAIHQENMAKRREEWAKERAAGMHDLVKRYDYDEFDGMVEADDGDYINYSDHVAAIERLSARIALLESGQPVEVRGEMWQLVRVVPSIKVKLAGAQELIDAMCKHQKDPRGDKAPLDHALIVHSAMLTASAQESADSPAYNIHDWPEDADHENGNYQNKCDVCGEMFIGHKRRHVCKRCAQENSHEG